MGVFVRNLVFYSGLKTTDVITDDQARDFLAQGDRALMVVPAETMDRLEREQRTAGAPPGGAALFQRSRRASATLLQPDPARDLTRVVLVSNK